MCVRSAADCQVAIASRGYCFDSHSGKPTGKPRGKAQGARRRDSGAAAAAAAAAASAAGLFSKLELFFRVFVF